VLAIHTETLQETALTKGYYIMATTIILATIASICTKYHITPEQFDKATKVIANGRKAFYIVESFSTPGARVPRRVEQRTPLLTMPTP
jgi:hypothetical protein